MSVGCELIGEIIGESIDPSTLSLFSVVQQQVLVQNVVVMVHVLILSPIQPRVCQRILFIISSPIISIMVSAHCMPKWMPHHRLVSIIACVCSGNFDGPTCEDCKPGWSGDSCDVAQDIRIRRAFTDLSTEELGNNNHTRSKTESTT